MTFSVLISCYKNDSPEDLKIALKSIWDEQTVKPAEIIVVKDGPLTPDLNSVIADFSRTAPVKEVPLEKNMGLGVALSIGIQKAGCEYIARMDSDDISLPDRFEKQLKYIEAHPETDLLGGAIDEFETDPEQIVSRRKLPLTNREIYRFIKRRSPFNHVTMFYRKQAILDVGNYQSFPNYEDYWLWSRCAVAGKIFANLPASLVKVRIGNGMLQRRRGLHFALSECKLAYKLHQIEILSFSCMLSNMLLRGGARLMPLPLLTLVYRLLRR